MQEKEKRLLFVAVMPISRQHEDNDLCVKNFVNQPMFFRNATAPLTGAVDRRYFKLSFEKQFFLSFDSILRFIL